MQMTQKYNVTLINDLYKIGLLAFSPAANPGGGSRNFVTLGKSDDIFRGVRGHSPQKFFEFWVSEMAFPALWELFKQNIKISNHIIFKKHFVQMKTFIKY